VELARKLVSIAPPGLTRVLLAPGGTSAMGMAVKLARAATGRFKTISMWESFHGASLDCISIGGERIFRDGMGPLLPGSRHVPPPDPHRCPFRCGNRCNLACAEFIEYILRAEGDVAAVIAEPIRCSPLIPPPDYWRRIRQACDRHRALLIFDEIPLGLGRTGRMFVCEHFGVAPDIMVLGKGLGGGVIPLAAMLAREALNSATPAGALGHYTHEKSPVACAAALATLGVIEEEGLVHRASDLGACALRGLGELARRHALISEVRGLGLVLGVVLHRRVEGGFAPANDEAEQVLYGSLRRGLNFKVSQGNILTLTPPLTVTRAQIDQAIGILDAALGELDGGNRAVS
jgi:4-aminobutyrate aminotransferase